MNEWAARAITLVVVTAAIVGTVALCLSVPPKIGIAIAVVVVVFAALATVPSWGRHVLSAACASLLALLALVALAVLTRIVLEALSIEGRLPIWLGLLLALGVSSASPSGTCTATGSVRAVGRRCCPRGGTGSDRRS
jgi:hypothetical protein